MFSSAKETVPNPAVTNGMSDAKDNMTNEGGRILHDVKDGVRRARQDARQAASALRDDLEDTARRTGQHMRELADSASHSVSDATETLTMKIRDNPIQSTLIALGIGAVFGMFYRR